jgi:N-acetylneuraminate synthase
MEPGPKGNSSAMPHVSRRPPSPPADVPGVAIGPSRVGPGAPCFVIAEAGSNHNGSLALAHALIDVAADAGADAVKFQLFRADRLYPRSAGTSDYLQVDRPIYDLVAEMETPYEWLPEMADHAARRGLVFLASVFDEVSADRLDAFVPAFKIASYEMTHLPLVQHVARKGKPVIISTGAATIAEVAETVAAVREVGNPNLVLMQCTAAYPAPLDAVNLRAIAALRDAFGVPVGLSDHSRDPLVAPLAAVALGAAALEKHLTLSNRLPGPDHAFAVEPDEFRLMVEKVRAAERALGTGEKVVLPVESELRGFARRSIFALRDIGAGEVLTADNVGVLRAGRLGGGLPPRELPNVLGRQAKRAIRAEEPLRPEDYG